MASEARRSSAPQAQERGCEHNGVGAGGSSRDGTKRSRPTPLRTPTLAALGACACLATRCVAFCPGSNARFSSQQRSLGPQQHFSQRGAMRSHPRYATRAPPETTDATAPESPPERYVYEPLEPLGMPHIDFEDGVMGDEDGDSWAGHMSGFDWQLERARRAAFSPFRMSFWEPAGPPPEGSVEAVAVAAAAAVGPVGNVGGATGVVTAWDTFYILATNILQKLGFPSVDGAPMAKIGGYEGSFLNFLAKVASGRLEELAGGPLFLMLEKFFRESGPVYKLAFGPRSFIVVSDPVMAKHILKANVGAYDKGVLASILEPIMGKGLIPADPETWKVRRRAIVPGFHKRWLNRMMQLFAECNQALLREVGSAAESGAILEMEEKFCSVSLDIIGAAVFNYDFGSTTVESPVIKAVYRVLREAEHRSSSFIPYWTLPYASKWLPSQKEFAADMQLLNDVLDELIGLAMATQQQAAVEELEERVEAAEDPSLLRFLVDMRGEDTTSKQLRDDLMTMLIAGHETTAAVLTWTLFNLAQDKNLMQRVQAEIDTVLGPDRLPTYDDLPALRLTRLALVEALRLYPEPPVLIRRALRADVLPRGGAENPIYLPRGSDVFISTWNLHRSPALWEEPEKYDPERFLRKFKNPSVVGWEGFKPELVNGLYPNEIAADFAFLPFGGGTRKCVGDQFAMMEATVTLCMLLRDFDLELSKPPEEVGMVTGATIHTANGLSMRARRRQKPAAAASSAAGFDSAASHWHVNGAGAGAANGAANGAATGAAKAAANGANGANGAGLNGCPHLEVAAAVPLQADSAGCPMHIGE